MSEVKHGQLRSGQYLGEISALCFVHLPLQVSTLPYLLVGMGSEIILYDLGTGLEIQSFRVFEGIRVHGISCSPIIGDAEGLKASTCSFKIVVYGEKKVKCFILRVQEDLEMENERDGSVDLIVYQVIPRFRHWVLDVIFLKESSSSLDENRNVVAVGSSDNSISIWDMVNSCMILEVKSPDVCLLYSMRLWGDDLKDLHVASGTIFNEIIVWKVQGCPASSTCSEVDSTYTDNRYQSNADSFQLQAVHICKLSGHEGSIFRMAWSLDGSMLMSVSDDRCARIWDVSCKKQNSVTRVEAHDRVLYGHTARVWDCCLSESLIVTAGEDCTCRVWDLNGVQLKLIKEHIGRGIWRCLYDPASSLLITAGFDSSVKIHQLKASLFQERGLHPASLDKTVAYSLGLPNSSGNNGHINSKSEYVRCLHFTTEDMLYVATNNGFLLQAKLSELRDVKWKELTHISKEAPIICLDVLPSLPSKPSCEMKDWIAIGDGKGVMTVVRVIKDVAAPKVDLAFMWSAESDRQLLGTYWSKSLGNRHIFTSDPRGRLKLWRLHHEKLGASGNASLMAEFVSCFGTRIICLDASFEGEVVVCGDLRGNLILFGLSKDLLSCETHEPQLQVPPLSYFRGVHGISSVASISVSYMSSSHSEIRSTGADGCICYLQHDRVENNLEFIGLKQVKELSLIQSVSSGLNCTDDSVSGSYAVGFASGSFIIWNLRSDTKVADVPCGGWRRPYSFFLGDRPELANCFAYVKDDLIHVHKNWVPLDQRTMIPDSLHVQFHGREIHSLCFISEGSNCKSNVMHSRMSGSRYIASGSEDGAVRLNRYTSGEWSESILLGEHVCGSAVRSICPVSEIHRPELDEPKFQCEGINPATSPSDTESPFLLISVGAKRVLTSWLMRKRRTNIKDEIDPYSITFQWLSSDMPNRTAKPRSKSIPNGYSAGVKEDDMHSGSLDKDGANSNGEDSFENDFRYMAVTAFLVKCSQSRLTVCFVIVACSDGSLAMRALILPLRFWFDVSVFVPVSSPVLTLQHVVTPSDNGGRFLLINGSTNGNITFWDLSESVYSFMRWISMLQIEKSVEGQKRPRTGRGSQGGKWWKSVGSDVSKKSPDRGQGAPCAENGTNSRTPDRVPSFQTNQSFSIREIQPLHVVKQAHRSGVNCLHVSKIRNSESSDTRYIVLSGGDDQSLHSLLFETELLPAILSPDIEASSPNPQNHQCRIVCLSQYKIASAHSSAVKGIWSDGTWAFSTGLDQRVRCWSIKESGNPCEQAHLVISVPEPETLDAIAYERGRYQIAVAGRGMQLLEFDAPIDPKH